MFLFIFLAGFKSQKKKNKPKLREQKGDISSSALFALAGAAVKLLQPISADNPVSTPGLESSAPSTPGLSAELKMSGRLKMYIKKRKLIEEIEPDAPSSKKQVLDVSQISGWKTLFFTFVKREAYVDILLLFILASVPVSENKMFTRQGLEELVDLSKKEEEKNLSEKSGGMLSVSRKPVSWLVQHEMKKLKINDEKVSVPCFNLCNAVHSKGNGNSAAKNNKKMRCFDEMRFRIFIKRSKDQEYDEIYRSVVVQGKYLIQ